MWYYRTILDSLQLHLDTQWCPSPGGPAGGVLGGGSNDGLGHQSHEPRAAPERRPLYSPGDADRLRRNLGKGDQPSVPAHRVGERPWVGHAVLQTVRPMRLTDALDEEGRHPHQLEALGRYLVATRPHKRRWDRQAEVAVAPAVDARIEGCCLHCLHVGTRASRVEQLPRRTASRAPSAAPFSVLMEK
eukprot:scaffold2003_cov119-Isochrysis_galbana.AAC.4